jgi:FkbM family methyltransferase
MFSRRLGSIWGKKLLVTFSRNEKVGPSTENYKQLKRLIAALTSNRQLNQVDINLSTSRGDSFNAKRICTDGIIFYVPLQGSEAMKDRFTDKMLRGWWPFKAIYDLLPYMRGGVMLDVGANVGTTSIPRAILGHFKEIHAFEPEPRNAACLAAAIRENSLEKRLHLWENGVGDKNQQDKLLMSAGIARHTVCSTFDCDKYETKTVNISMISLDDWGADKSKLMEDVRFVKVDTQGHELKVMKGAAKFLTNRKAVWQLEVSPRHLKHANSNLADMLSLIRQNFDFAVDLRRRENGVISTSRLPEELDYLGKERRFTDLLVFNRIVD